MVHSSTPEPEVPSRSVMTYATCFMSRFEPVMSSIVVLVHVCGFQTSRG